jgi:hypothetical protein
LDKDVSWLNNRLEDANAVFEVAKEWFERDTSWLNNRLEEG